MNKFFQLLVFLFPFGLIAGSLPPGAPIFRGNCAFCHGLNGKGGRGPSLVSSRVAQTSDEAIQSVIRSGISGTGMPAFELEKNELASLVLYIRGLSVNAGPKASFPGDVAHGRQLYGASGCANCHRIGFAGSIYGPELTRIGLARSVEYLRESILNPSADIPTEYAGVSVVTKSGKHLQGVRINEDTFSVQLRLSDQEFALFEKSKLKSVENLSASLMPPYDKLPPRDVDDLIAYLNTLQGDTSATEISKPKGIH